VRTLKFGTMKKIHLLILTSAFGIIIMLTAFEVAPDGYPWYYDFSLFNAGLWPWLFAKNELNKMKY
jgi:hypothetical protein